MGQSQFDLHSPIKEYVSGPPVREVETGLAVMMISSNWIFTPTFSFSHSNPGFADLWQNIT
jgi:hypothetical protein